MSFPRPVPRALGVALAAGLGVIAGLAPAHAEEPRTLIVQGLTEGSTRATRWGITPAGPCMGVVPDEPHYTIYLDAPARVRIRVRSAADTTLVVLDAATVRDSRPKAWCNDDADGLNPSISQILDAGTYHIRVGTWETGTSSSFMMNIDVEPVTPVEPVEPAAPQTPPDSRRRLGYSADSAPANEMPKRSNSWSSFPVHIIAFILKSPMNDQRGYLNDAGLFFSTKKWPTHAGP